MWFTSFYVRAVMPAMSTKPRGIYLHAYREHLVSDRTSRIFRQLHNSPQYRTLFSDDCFNILDHASTTFQLKIREDILIQWEIPTLNHQIYYVNLKLSL